jgi:Rod binding domain-containing protein
MTMNLSALHSATVAGAPVNLSEIPIEQLAGNKKLSEAEKVKEVSRQFEAVILRQILSQARKSVFHSSLDGESATSGIYQDMVTNQLAESISRSGDFGLARSLEAQLVNQTVSKSSHTPPADPGVVGKK